MEEYLKRYGVDLNQESPILVPGFSRTKDLPKLFKHLGLVKGAEIGVGGGKNARRLCRVTTEFICVDSYNAMTNPQKGFEYTAGKHKEREQQARERLKDFNVRFIIKSSMDAVKDIPMESLDFVYIDANHTRKCAKEDLEEWSKRVRPGGIVSGHDYINNANCGVKDAVDEYATGRWFITSDGMPSYFWMK